MIAPVRILGIGGSTVPGSVSEALLRATLAAAAGLGAQTRLYRAADLDFPLYSTECAVRDDELRAFLDDARAADGLVLCSPAYHGTITGRLKNALDYLEDLAADTPPYLTDRAIACIAIGGGSQAAALTLNALRTIVHALRGWPTPTGLGLSKKEVIFDDHGAIGDPAVAARVELLARQVVDSVRMRRMYAAAQAAENPSATFTPS
ncbi:MAG: NAD(P)H-dependent oxidoreductase [Vulcanimicrobiaceae bacterium]